MNDLEKEISAHVQEENPTFPNKGEMHVVADFGMLKAKLAQKDVEMPSVSTAIEVNIHSLPAHSAERGFKSAGEDSYVISPIDGSDKYSRLYFNCTGIICFGKEKGTGKTISFLTHQNPEYIFANSQQRGRFVSDLEASLDDLMTKSEDGTIESAVFGGNISNLSTESKKLSSNIILKKTGLAPRSLNELKNTAQSVSVFVHTAGREIELKRS